MNQAVVDLILKFGIAKDFASALGISEASAKAMRLRGSIRGEYWKAMVDAASARGIEGVTLSTLAEAHAANRGERFAGGRDPAGQRVVQGAS